MVSHVYLSPHLDDAVLSCGGQIAQRVQSGEQVWVVTVFAGDPVGELSPFAQLLHERWGLPYHAPVERRAEDQAALALLGAESVQWALPECIYRRAADGAFLYPSEESLWDHLHPADGTLVEEVARRIASLPGEVSLYVPLGAGGHVDHKLVRQAAEATGWPLLYYEEYPYAEDPQAITAAQAGGTWQPQLVLLDEEALVAKVSAVARYHSQLSTFWEDEAEMTDHIRAYGLSVGEGRLAERGWQKRCV